MKIDFDFFKIKQRITPQKGRIIISEPFLHGELFSRSAVLLVEYSSQGAVGFILNKPFESDLNDLFSMPLGYTPELFTGGPVSPDNLFYVHTLGAQLEGSIQIKDQLSWGGDFEALKFALVTGTVKPEQVKFFVGYSGWSAGQLEQEIAENSWLVVESDTYQVMNSNRNFWLESVKSAGGHYETWQNFPVDPNAN